jgi:MFS family permease
MGWISASSSSHERPPCGLLPGLTEVELTTHAGYVTMIFIFGWATGGLIFGMLGDRIGRARTMMLTILIYAAFTGLSALAREWWDFALFRFLCGIGIGGEYAAGVALVAEVVPTRARPYCLGLLQGLGALGHLLASWISIYLGPESDFMGSPAGGFSSCSESRPLCWQSLSAFAFANRTRGSRRVRTPGRMPRIGGTARRNASRDNWAISLYIP